MFGFISSEKLKTCIDCPVGWSIYQDSCFYIERSVSISWSDARQQCVNRGGELLTFEDENFYNYWIPLANFFDLSNSSTSATNTIVI